MALFKPKDKEIQLITARKFVQTFSKLMKQVGHPSAVAEIDPRQLYRYSWTLTDWKNAVDDAEDVHNQNLFNLAEIYHDIVDDYAVHSSMQQRTSKAINSKMMFVDRDGEENEDVKAFFLETDGSQKSWFRRWLKAAMDEKYYGFVVAELGAYLDSEFRQVNGRHSVEKIPYENLVPMKRLIKKDAEAGIFEGNVISMDQGKYSQWLIPMGECCNIGLLNKAVPYVIFKQVFENWRHHAEIFGMPFREGRTEIRDNERVKNMMQMFEEMVSSTYGIFHPDDEIKFIETSKTDAFQIYNALIEKCDLAITKIFLSQTGTTDEKAYVGSSEAHERVMSDVVMSDRFDITEKFNEILIPKLKRLKILPENVDISLVWIVEEHLSLKDWATIIQQLSGAYKIPVDEINKRFDMEVEEKATPEPNPQEEDLESQPQPEGFKEKMEKVQNLYLKLWQGTSKK